MQKLSVIIPCFNEVATIEETVARSAAVALPDGWTREIIVVDDGSTDGSRNVLHRLAHEGRIQLIEHAINRGKGAAVKSGLTVSTGEYAVIQDADLEYDPADYGALLQPIIEGRAVSVFGSRNLGTNNVPYSRIFFYGGLLVTQIFNIVYFTRLTDIATCYKVFPRRFFSELIASDHDDFVFDAVVLTRALVRGGVLEVPINYAARDKKAGKKLTATHGIKIVAAIFLTRIGLAAARFTHLSAQIIRFVISGTLAMLVNVGFLYFFTDVFGIWYITSSIFAFCFAFAFNFVTQKYWVFESMDHAKAKKQLPMKLAANLVNLGLNTLLLYTFVEHAHLHYIFAQIVTSFILAFESFIIYRWIFK